MTNTMYLNGDLAEYNGKSQLLHGAMCYEVVMIEGHLAGQIRHTYNAPRGSIYTYNNKKSCLNGMQVNVIERDNMVDLHPVVGTSKSTKTYSMPIATFKKAISTGHYTPKTA
jgi:hypothetical protein